MITLSNPNQLGDFLPEDLESCWLNLEDVPESFKLGTGEASIVSDNFTAKRMSEFRMGRAAAHYVVGKLGIELGEGILKGPEGEPLWPSGCVGSISHSSTAALAVASHSKDFQGIGVDLELWNPSRDYSFLKRALNSPELEWAGDDFKKGLQIFSAKEALYKLVYSTWTQKPKFTSVSFKKTKPGTLSGSWTSQSSERKKLPNPLCYNFEVQNSNTSHYIISLCYLKC